MAIVGLQIAIGKRYAASAALVSVPLMSERSLSRGVPVCHELDRYT
jgi:hypothetical protein